MLVWIQVMSLVRNALDTPESGLNREQFALALRLVAAAQVILLALLLRLEWHSSSCWHLPSSLTTQFVPSKIMPLPNTDCTEA